MIIEIKNDIFSSKAQTIVIPVNTVGVMGKGLALEAKLKYPALFTEYRNLCKQNLIKIGQPYLVKNFKPWFLLFPTKRHWKENSNLDYIIKGLIWLIENYKKEQITSIAVPALGCGAGNLDWKQVKPVLYYYLSKLDIHVEIYPPLYKKFKPSKYYAP